MNTAITPLFDEDTDEFAGYDFDEELADKVIGSLARNNTFMPNVDRVVYNTKVEDVVTKLDENGNPVKGPDGKTLRHTVRLESPVLATTVYFVDGTKVTVKNSDKDAITLSKEKVRLSDGTETEVETASRESKEMGLVYALVKRAVCGFDEDGTVQNAGFAKFLHKTVDKASVQDIEHARAAAERKIRRNKASAPAPAKKPRTCGGKGLGSVVRNLAETVSGLKDIVSKLVKDKSPEENEAPAPQGE